MLQRLRPRLTYANVVSSLALFIVLGGGAYAATQLEPNSVGTKHLKKNAVKKAKIAPNSVGTGKVINNSIRGIDVREPTLGQVPSAKQSDFATNAATLNDHTFGYFEAAHRTEFGSANRTSTARERILEWTNAHAMVITDGDGDAAAQVRVRNTGAAADGDLLVIDAAGNFIVVNPGEDSAQITGNPGELQFVLARPDGRTAWVRCAFPAFVGAPVRCLGERSGPN